MGTVERAVSGSESAIRGKIDSKMGDRYIKAANGAMATTARKLNRPRPRLVTKAGDAQKRNVL
jgi:hypothetical protein